MSCKKSDIAKLISSKISISNTYSKEIVDSFIDLVKFKSNENNIKISNLGTFCNKITPERIGRNPKTLEEHIIKERIKLYFIVSNKVKKQLN